MDTESVVLVKSFWQLFSEQKWDMAGELLHADFEANWPQSREKICSGDNFININKFYPGNHTITVIHIFEIGPKILTTVWIDADTGQQTFANSIFEIRDGKIFRVEEYWAAPYPAPEGRKQWVEIY